MASGKIILQQKQINSKCYARTTASTRNNKIRSLSCLTIFRKRGIPHHQGVISSRGRQKAVCDILGSYLNLKPWINQETDDWSKHFEAKYVHIRPMYEISSFQK